MKSIAVLFMFASAACQPSASRPVPIVQTVGATSAPVERYRTFAFGPAEQPHAPYRLSARSFEVERRAQALVVTELTKKGYALSDGNADFLLQISAGNTEQEVGSGGEMMGGSTERVHIGELAVDAFDGSSHTQIWHGTADARINPQKIDDGVLQSAVEQLLARFPVRSTNMDRSGEIEHRPR
jgi:hypothetical protein